MNKFSDFVAATFNGPLNPPVSHFKRGSWNDSYVDEGANKSTSASRDIDAKMAVLYAVIVINPFMRYEIVFEGFIAPTSGSSSSPAQRHMLFNAKCC